MVSGLGQGWEERMGRGIKRAAKGGDVSGLGGAGQGRVGEGERNQKSSRRPQWGELVRRAGGRVGVGWERVHC